MDYTGEHFGALGIGDDTIPLQTAFDSLHQSDRLLLSGTYNVSAPLHIGNGSALSPSTRQCFTIEGSARPGIYNDGREGSGGCIINYQGPPTTEPVLTVAGPILGLSLKNVKVQCQGLAPTGIHLCHLQRSTIENIHVTGYIASPGMAAFIIDAYSSVPSVWNGAGDNTISGLACTGPAHPSAGGIIIGSNVKPIYPYLDACRILMLGGWFTAGLQGDAFTLQYTDSCTFIGLHTFQGTAFVINHPEGFLNYPAEIAFVNCGFHGPHRIPADWDPVGKITFIPYPIGDGAIIPNNNGIMGLATNGNLFGFEARNREYLFLSRSSSMFTSNKTETVIPDASFTIPSGEIGSLGLIDVTWTGIISVSGTSYATPTFRIRCDGNVLASSTVTSASTSLLTFTVSAVIKLNNGSFRLCDGRFSLGGSVYSANMSSVASHSLGDLLIQMSTEFPQSSYSSTVTLHEVNVKITRL